MGKGHLRIVCTGGENGIEHFGAKLQERCGMSDRHGYFHTLDHSHDILTMRQVSAVREMRN